MPSVILLTQIYGIWTDGNDNAVCATAKETQTIEQAFRHVGEGEGGMISENGIETCIISYKKLIASPGSTQKLQFLKKIKETKFRTRWLHRRIL